MENFRMENGVLRQAQDDKRFDNLMILFKTALPNPVNPSNPSIRGRTFSNAHTSLLIQTFSNTHAFNFAGNDWLPAKCNLAFNFSKLHFVRFLNPPAIVQKLVKAVQMHPAAPVVIRPKKVYLPLF